MAIFAVGTAMLTITWHMRSNEDEHADLRVDQFSQQDASRTIHYVLKRLENFGWPLQQERLLPFTD
ncbi:hypothetical protein GJQ57_00010 [Ralstonia pickettii]|uniref:Uncharacterized protein n=1 Tax=Ralstonia pickettii TaxID=329 RepID=A0A7X2L8P1_RALPI|nr:hypothetical protein [Ralstonia pickettii]MRS97026.1 hypothetical protein [Ralstonia pickettii]